MKKIVFGIMVLCLLQLVVAADLEISINGQSLDQEITLEPGSQVTTEVMVKQGVKVTDISVQGSNAVINRIIEEQISTLEDAKLFEQDKTVSESFTLPDLMPAGAHEVQPVIKYTSSAQAHELSPKATLDIPSSGFLSSVLGAITGVLSEDGAYVLIDRLGLAKKEPIPRELTDDELVGVAQLTQSNVDNKQYSVSKIASDEQSEINPKDVLVESADQVVNDALSELDTQRSFGIEKTLDVFEVTNTETGQKETVSKIIVKLVGKKTTKNVEVIEVVSKEVAADVSDLDFSKNIEVILADPAVKWKFDYAAKNKGAEASYIAKSSKQELDSTTRVGATKLDFQGSSLEFLIDGGWIVVLLVLVVIIVGVPILRKGKKKDKK